MEERARTEEEEMTLEEAFVRLDGMVERLETRGIPLEESFQIYKEGMELLKKCNDKIDTVEKKMLQVNKSGEYSEF
ncbi:exodeoxyribonuclease VII small subunit [Lachnospiraceae bacterium OF09-33XD]|uniref:Exodeoxyribonuclease 7 small subunit n=2 Tax=Wansuia hejianensis TaxID=2763667 RepID=A0A7G9GIF4_9FIRM|nr:exodeoxyribonuclease VII small subunit [Wansuia hejianensis]RHV88911.1 exodeoxyribonuclease VII small subunit [Lachnospiraceae bacterium OF09-33XD]